MNLEVVPIANTHAAIPAPVAPPREAFCCVRASRRVVLTPRYGEGRKEVEVRYLWTGAPGAPTVIVQGGISAGREVCSTADASADGWWDALVGCGKAVDLDRVRVLSIDWLSACDLDADSVSSDDQADALAALLDALHVGKVHAFIGCSYGAMAGLAFAARHGHRLQRLVAIAGAHRPHPMATAQRSVQRGIVRLGLAHDCREAATSLARQLAVTTYRGASEFAERFDGEAQFHDGRYRLPVEQYLDHVGSKFAQSFDPERYLALSESIDLHRVDPSQVRVPTTLIGFSTDRLVPLADMCQLQRSLGGAATLEVIRSRYGHDGFLKESAHLVPLLRDALM